MPRPATTRSKPVPSKRRSTKAPAAKISTLLPLMSHQNASVEFANNLNEILDLSSAGTGKTVVHLALWAERRRNGGGKLLVVCPRSIMSAAWATDLIKFFGYEFTPALAYATNRLQAFQTDADLVITNTDAVKWVVKNTKLLKGFDSIIVDESDAFRHSTSQRTKALLNLAKYFRYKTCLTATPFDGSITEIWAQAAFLDNGKRLGTSFYSFRNAVTTPIQVGPLPTMRKWVDKPGSEEAVAGLLQDITIRHKFEDCVDIPPNTVRMIHVELSTKHRKLYEELKREALLELKKGDVTGVNAAVLANKILQLTSGSVYSSAGAELIDTDRYELIAQLVHERDHSVVFFNWDHQRDELIRLFKSAGIEHEHIDGSVNDRRRAQIVEAYQAGYYQTLLLQPQSAAHGLTLTRGRATIWASPVYRASLFTQGSHRIYRTGQTRKTETLLIAANNTIEERVYQVMQDKKSKLSTLMEMLE